LPFEDIEICHSGTVGSGRAFEGMIYVKQRDVSGVPSGNSKTSNAQGRWIAFRAQGNINDKKCINVMSSLM
jgi:hypothetical protein